MWTIAGGIILAVIGLILIALFIMWLIRCFLILKDKRETDKDELIGRIALIFFIGFIIWCIIKFYIKVNS